MTSTQPAWWPRVHDTVRGMRRFTGLMLDLAAPHLDEHGTLRVAFTQGAAAEHFRSEDSGCMRDLRTALTHHGIEPRIDIAA